MHYGWFGREVLYIPYNVIACVAAKQVILTMDAASIHEQPWKLKPRAPEPKRQPRPGRASAAGRTLAAVVAAARSFWRRIMLLLWIAITIALVGLTIIAAIVVRHWRRQRTDRAPQEQHLAANYTPGGAVSGGSSQAREQTPAPEPVRRPRWRRLLG